MTQKTPLAEKYKIVCAKYLSLPNNYEKLLTYMNRVSNDGQEFNIGETIDDLMNVDPVSFSKMAGVGQTYVQSLVSFQEALPSMTGVLEDAYCRHVKAEAKAEISLFVGMDSAPNIPFKLSSICINLSFLSGDEKKLLEKMEKILGKKDLLSILETNEAVLLESSGFGSKYLRTFQVLKNAVEDEVLDIVAGRKPMSFESKNILVVSEYFDVDLSKIDLMLLDDVEEYFFSLDAASRDIILSRWGFHCKSESLEEIATRQGVTRERIRQKEMGIIAGLRSSIRIHPDVLRENIMRCGTTDIYKTVDGLSSCFGSERQFYTFLEELCQAETGSIFDMMCPEVRATFLDAYFCENISPVNREVLIQELVSNYRYDKDLAANVLTELQKKLRLKIVFDEVSPINLGRKEAVAHILLSHPNGLPWKDVTRLVNKSGCCSTYINENRMVNSYFGDSNYVYLCGRGTYRHINFFNTAKIDVPSIMDDILECFVSNNVESIHLHDFYHTAKPYIKALDYFDFRQVVRSYGDSYGFFFNGKSNVDGLGITSDFTQVTQKTMILDIMVKAKGAITKAEIAERLRSKSINHANFYIDQMIEEGTVVRIDNMMYTTPEKAFANVDTECILRLMNDILIGSNKIVEADFFRLKINSELKLGYTKYLYAALASVNLEKFGWKKKYNLFDHKNISYKSLNDIFSSICDLGYSNSENLEKVRQELMLTDQVAESAINNWRASLNLD